MSIDQLKITVVQEILKSTDEQFIRFLSALVTSKQTEDTEGSEEVPDHIRESIEKSRRDIEEGKVFSWDEVKSKLIRK